MVITEPWAEVLPAGDAVADLDGRFRDPDQPVILARTRRLLPQLGAAGHVRCAPAPEAHVGTLDVRVSARFNT